MNDGKDDEHSEEPLVVESEPKPAQVIGPKHLRNRKQRARKKKTMAELRKMPGYIEKDEWKEKKKAGVQERPTFTNFKATNTGSKRLRPDLRDVLAETRKRTAVRPSLDNDVQEKKKIEVTEFHTIMGEPEKDKPRDSPGREWHGYEHLKPPVPRSRSRSRRRPEPKLHRSKSRPGRKPSRRKTSKEDSRGPPQRQVLEVSVGSDSGDDSDTDWKRKSTKRS